ncbi:hypothetical protein PI124_g12185 [Phytophthora idaei]|nr:hypothetical protein PI125_g11828 [Phytophthora idaei]KAG3242996.1 hypothetical protein PI124_g12185 [Phytophthora idaei]
MILGRPLRQELLYAEPALRTPTRSVSPLSANRNGTDTGASHMLLKCVGSLGRALVRNVLRVEQTQVSCIHFHGRKQQRPATRHRAN